LRWRRLPWILEVISIALGYGLYSFARLLAPSSDATAHAYRLLDLERAFGLFHELAFNAFLVQHHWLIEFASYYYATAHFVITPLVLMWLFRQHSWAYAILRSGLVLATLVALVVYATWPLAPPRFVVSGAVDTVFQSPVIWAREGAASFVNEFAAMPSLHVAWAVWCSVAVITVMKTRWRHLAWAYPLTTTWVVVATANHYLLDAVAGLVVAVVPLWLCGLRPRDVFGRRWHPVVHPPLPEPVAA
jgi:hypothetical protein